MTRSRRVPDRSSSPHVHGRPRLRLVAAAFLAGLVLFATPASAAPQSEVPPEQLEQAKKLFGEAQAAMDSRDYGTAQTKFTEAYRLAPHLHLFNYNIAVAAQLGGDCRDAQIYFQAFLDLVPEHPERNDAQKRLTKLKKDCPVDLESESVLSSEGQAKRDGERVIERAISAMNDLLVQLQWGAEYYASAHETFPNAAFRRAAKRKQRDLKKLRKIMATHRVRDEKREPMPLVIPEDLKSGCRRGRSHEGRIGRVAEEALQYFETRESVAALTKILRGSQRDGDAFDACSKR